jgi:hypothetical protein
MPKYPFSFSSHVEMMTHRLTHLHELALETGKPVIVYDPHGDFTTILDDGSIPYSSMSQEDVEKHRLNYENMSPGLKIVLGTAAGAFFRDWSKDLACKPSSHP